MNIARHNLVLFVIILSVFLAACGNTGSENNSSPTETAALQPSPTFEETPTTIPTATYTATPEATDTPEPTNTPKPTNTPPPTPTATATAAPTQPPFALGAVITVTEGGFTFRPVEGFLVNTEANEVNIFSEDNEIILFMTADTVDDEGMSLPELMDGFMASINTDGDELAADTAYPYFIDGVEGLAVDITGKFLGNEIDGRVAIAAPGANRIFLAFGAAMNSRWETEGANLFEAVLNSVVFLEEVGETLDTPADNTESSSDLPLPLPTGKPAAEWNGWPIMPQALAGNEGDGSYYFTVAATKEDVQNFYAEEMGQRGWELLATGEGENGALLMIFQQGEETASAAIFQLDDNTVYVFLVR